MPQSLLPRHYHIHITPDMDRFQFKGRVRIRLQADAPVEQVTLNALELAVWRCGLQHQDALMDCAFAVDPDNQTFTVTLPRPLSGEFDLQVDYEGLINDQMAGFYRSAFTHQGRTRYIAVTQFQESEARRAFPCLDHPRHKAVFELELIVPADLTALANTLPVEQKLLDDQRKQVRFHPTPCMSTYLLFFGVGDFEHVRDKEDPRVRVVHLPGLAHTTDLGLDFGRKALQFCERYYGIAYPLDKMDLIAVPDFAFGAMENWGAITFRENLLLRFPDLTSKAGVQRICEVIAHEIAHQWFGNLVTPADWKYLWLNESFATYFGYGVMAHHYPQWRVWDQFLNDETALALARDGLRETFAIEIPGDQHIAINVSTAPIIYNKGASILRMIEGYIGQDAYQQGVIRYLMQHQYGCAQSRHLWEAFETAANQPITAIMQGWISQPGHPLITARRRDNALILHQERFSYLPGVSDQTWPVPITLTFWKADAQIESRQLLLEDRQTTIEMPADADAYKINAGQTGFYRVQYDDADNFRALGALVADQRLPVQDRWGLQEDLYALVCRGNAKLSDYLDFLTYYAQERDYLPLVSITSHLYEAFVVAPEAPRGAIAAAGRSLAEQVLSHIGYAPAADEPLTTSVLRDQLLWQAVVWGAEQVAAFCADQFEQLTKGQSVHPDIAKGVLQAAAWTQTQTALDWLCARFAQSPSEHERMNILTALGAFRSWDAARQALAFTLDKVPPRNRFVPIVAAAANPCHQDRLWGWYQAHLTQLESFHPLLYERVITGLWPYGGLERPEQVQDFGQAYIRSHPVLADAVKLALEHLAINVRLRANMART